MKTESAKEQLHKIFKCLDKQIDEINVQRQGEGLFALTKAKAQVLGQMSLLVNEKTAVVLSLAQTADLDALLVMDHIVKVELKKLLEEQGLIYDEDSYLIWIPPKAKFEKLFEFKNIVIELLDPESVLVSKAIKAPGKNKQLIREAIALEQFPTLVERILKNGGKLEDFL